MMPRRRLGAALITRETRLTSAGVVETYRVDDWDLDRGRLYVSGMNLRALGSGPFTRTWYGLRVCGRRFVYLCEILDRDRDRVTYVAASAPWWLCIHAAALLNQLVLYDVARLLWRCGISQHQGQPLSWHLLGRALCSTLKGGQ